MGKNKPNNQNVGQLSANKVKSYKQNYDNKNTYNEQSNNNKNSFK
ncbi:hypothetical protein [Clostridium baratii]